MHIIPILTEQTTAFTDLLLAILTVIVIISLRRAGRHVDPKKTLIWTWAFILLTMAAVFGAAAHGFVMSEKLNLLLWQPINLSLGLAVSLFVVGVIYDLKYFTVSKQVIVILLILGLLFYAVTLFIPGAFVVFIIYEALAMLFALVIYVRLAAVRKMPGAWLMAAGILITMIAAGIQASESVFVTLIWEFDFNGIFHITQMLGLVVLLFGLRGELLSRDSESLGILNP